MSAILAGGSDRTLLRVAGAAAVVGTTLAIPATLLHPTPDPDLERAFLTEVDQSGGWIVIHLVALVAYSMSPIIFLGMHRSIGGDNARVVATIGYAFALIGTAIAFSWTVVDGVAMKHIVSDYFAVSGGARETAFPAADAIEHIILAYWSMCWIAWFGIPWTLFGLAMVLSESWPAWLGWAGIGTGVFTAAVGVAQLFTERTLATSDILFPISSLFASVWIAGMGVLLWRRGGAIAA